MRKKLVIYTLIFFAVLCAVYIPAAAVVRTSEDDAELDSIYSEEKNVTNTAKTIMSQRTTRLVSDLLYISDSLRIAGGARERLISDWTAFSNRKKVYDQIRYIDGNGEEKIGRAHV